MVSSKPNRMVRMPEFQNIDFKDAEPILVQISRLNINPPSNLELDEIMIQKEAAKHLKTMAS